MTGHHLPDEPVLDPEDKVLDDMIAEVERRRRNDRLQKWGLFILTMLLLIAAVVIWDQKTHETVRADASSEQASDEQTAKKEVAKEAQQALCREGDKEIYDRSLCEKWASIAGEKPIEAAPPVDNSPTQAELVAAFRVYCDAGNCRGADGRSPDANDIAAAFVKFCSDGHCTGPKGEDGGKGADGKDAIPLAPEYGMVLAAVQEVCSTGICTGPAGKDGLNATPEMVAVAVQNFCANDVCRGPAGPTGKDGVTPKVITWNDPRTGEKYTCTPESEGSTTFTCTIEPKTPNPLEPILGGTP